MYHTRLGLSLHDPQDTVGFTPHICKGNHDEGWDRWPCSWPGYPCVRASRMARYWRRLSLIADSFCCALNSEYTMEATS
jgi:hypothetical protein